MACWEVVPISCGTVQDVDGCEPRLLPFLPLLGCEQASQTAEMLITSMEPRMRFLWFWHLNFLG